MMREGDKPASSLELTGPMTDPDSVTDAFNAWWPRHAVRHNSRSPVAAREAFDAGFNAGRAAERQCLLRPLIAAHPRQESEWGAYCGKCWTRGGSHPVWPCPDLQMLAEMRDGDARQQRPDELDGKEARTE